MANLTLKSGYNVTLTEDPSAGTLTISATDTKYTIDSTLSGSSTNPIQNKVVYTALAGKQDKLIAGTGISISGNTISCTVSGGSGGGSSVTVDSALSGTSTNPVQNKVIYTALQGKQDKINYETWTFTTVSGTTVTKKVYIA